ncbi:MAG: hypothetical protein OXC26_00170 [Albidovulum sp.]|nr:hypothetical protein [Albidovulum sp.]
MTSDRVVMCMKFGTKFTADDVNVLYNAVKKNLNPPYRFVCLTNDKSEINANVECFSIPEIGLDEWHWYNGVWPKLSVFLPNLFGLEGRCLFLDLNNMILDDLSPFFKEQRPFIGINYGSRVNILGTGVFSFDFGSQSQIIEEFCSNRDKYVARYIVEQAFVQDFASSVEYWPSNWVLSFKRDLHHRNFTGLFLTPREIPNSAKIIKFHGKPVPRDLLRKGIWGRFPHLGWGKVDWIEQYYKTYSK